MPRVTSVAVNGIIKDNGAAGQTTVKEGILYCDALRSFSKEPLGHSSNIKRRLEIDQIISSFLVLHWTQRWG